MAKESIDYSKYSKDNLVYIVNEMKKINKVNLENEERNSILEKSLPFKTKIYNRKYFEDSIRLEIINADRKKTVLGVLSGDVDKLKLINDTYGHPFGDKAIIKAGDFINNATRENDLVFRIGGDEFAVITRNNDIPTLIQRMNDKIKSYNETLPEKDKLNISIGYHIYKSSDFKGKSISYKTDELKKIVDKKMYKAKELKKSQSQ